MQSPQSPGSVKVVPVGLPEVDGLRCGVYLLVYQMWMVSGVVCTCWSSRCGWSQVWCVPVGLPDVDGLWVCDAVVGRLVVQQVKEVLDGERDRPAGAQDHGEQVVHKLLKRSL